MPFPFQYSCTSNRQTHTICPIVDSNTDSISTSCSLLPAHCEDQAVTRPSALVREVHLRPGIKGGGERRVSVAGTEGAGVPVSVSSMWQVMGGREVAILRSEVLYRVVGVVGVGGC